MDVAPGHPGSTHTESVCMLSGAATTANQQGCASAILSNGTGHHHASQVAERELCCGLLVDIISPQQHGK